MPTIHHEPLEKFSTALFAAAGAPQKHAQIVALHLVESNLKGHDSHGIMRVTQYLREMKSGHICASAEAEVLREFGNTAVINGHRGFGQVIAMQAMEMAITKAREAGVAAISMYDSAHTGRLGTYAERAADEGMLGMVLVNASGGGQSVAPFGGLDRRLATNPIAIAAPSDNRHAIVLDMATSVVPEGKVRDYYKRGAQLPDGSLRDFDGNPTNDPKAYYSDLPGAIQPLGGGLGYKGFGLAFMIDILAGGLSGAGCCSQEETPLRDAMLLIAFNIDAFSSSQKLNKSVQALVEHVKSSRRAPGVNEILVPGEVEAQAEEERRANGIEINHTVWNELFSAAAELGVPVPDTVQT